MDMELEDDFRYNLIYENERLKSESQTKGLHIIIFDLNLWF